MIIDSLKNHALYASVNPRFAKAFEFLTTRDFSAMEPGRYEIDGDEIFLSLNVGELKKPENAALEVHDKYIDIQLVLSGRESFGWRDRRECSAPHGEMNNDKDILFFEDKPSTTFTLHDGQFCILFPEDAHAPMIGDGQIRKAIVKVKA